MKQNLHCSITVFRCFSPFKIRIHIFWKYKFELSFHNIVSKRYRLNFFLVKSLRKIFLWQNWDFCGLVNYFSMQCGHQLLSGDKTLWTHLGFITKLFFALLKNKAEFARLLPIWGAQDLQHQLWHRFRRESAATIVQWEVPGTARHNYMYCSGVQVSCSVVQGTARHNYM